MQENVNTHFPKEPQSGFDFWKNLILVIIFSIAAPLTIAVSIFTLTLIPNAETKSPKVLSAASYGETQGVQLFASLPSKVPVVYETVESADARPERLREYFEYYHSNLLPYAEEFVKVADFYGLDYKLMPAIAQQESNLCKWIPPETHNCWGWGIHKAGTLGFGSYEEAIWTVAQGLKYEYIDKGYLTPEEIMSKYTPSSNGSWARGVSQFMEEID